MFVVGAGTTKEDTTNKTKDHTTVAFAATSTRNFLVCLPFFSYFACALSVLLVFAANAQREVQIPDLSMPNMKEYVHNMYAHYRVSVLVQP